jgi:hypothetical protein
MKRPAKEESKKLIEASKEILLQKLNSLKTEAAASIRDLTSHLEDMITSIRSNMQEVQQELEVFVTYCDKCINYINSQSNIPSSKLFLSPLETILTTPNPNLENLKGPELCIEDSYTRPFRLYLPTVAHVLNNYNWTISLENDKIFVLGPNIVYNYDEFKQDIDSTTRYLMVSDSKVLFAGGVSWKDFTAFIDISLNKARVLTKLTTGRYKHSLAWLDGNPAVFGGVGENGEVLSSVEVLVGNEWKVHSNMVHKRCNLTSVSCLGKVYLVGGSSDHEGKHPYSSIEVWNTFWEVLNVGLPCGICNVGVVSYGDGIFLLGGKNKAHEGTAVFKMGLGTGGKCKRLAVMEEFMFKNNSVVAAHFFIKGKCYKKQKSDTQIVVDFNVLTQSLEVCKRY